MIRNLLFLLLFPTGAAFSQKIKDAELDAVSLKYAKASFTELSEFFSLPNDAYYPKDIENNIDWCEGAFSARGFKTEQLATETVPLLLASKINPKAKKTVLIYLQIDGQPVDTTKWLQPNPYQPVLKEKTTIDGWQTIPWSKLKGEIDPDWRIFARSASDAKGPVMMFLKAMDVINDRKINPKYNIKVIMDFEEELGSPRLPGAVIRFQEKLKADMLVIFDGPRHISNQPTLSYGARGIATISLEVFGPRAPQHSGHYGNYVPNPALKLSQLLSSMMQGDGRVAIPGWYDGIEISDDVREILKQVPDNEDEIRRKMGVASVDNIGGTYQEAMQYPSLGILGLESGWVGNETRTIVPSSAVAEMNIRLVKETNAQRMVDLVKSHIIKQGYYLVDSIPTEAERSKHSKIARFNYEISYGAFRTDFDTEIGSFLRKSMVRAFGKDPIQIRTAGGSIPISPFVITLNIPAVAVPTVNSDNNQHSPNENIRLGNYIDGIKTITAILSQEL